MTTLPCCSAAFFGEGGAPLFFVFCCFFFWGGGQGAGAVPRGDFGTGAGSSLVARRTHGDLVSGLYHQILLSLQKVLADPVRPLCSHYGAVVGLHALGWKVSEVWGVCVGGVQRCLSMPPAPRTIPPLLVPAGSGARPLPAPLHLLGQPAGRAGRLLRLQRPGEGRRAQSLRRHPGEWPGGGRLGTPSLGFPRCPRSLPRWLWSAC